MLKFNEESAITTAVEIAKIVCANPNTRLYADKESADGIADFIRTLEQRFRNEENPLESNQ